jgi:hypothetical protein
MASKYIGVIRDTETGEIFSVINPDNDSELDNPRWLLLRVTETRSMQMVRVPRGDYMGAMTTAQLAALVDKLQKQ